MRPMSLLSLLLDGDVGVGFAHTSCMPHKRNRQGESSKHKQQAASNKQAKSKHQAAKSMQQPSNSREPAANNGNCWELLGAAGSCWELLSCWHMLGAAGSCWELLGSAGSCWELLEAELLDLLMLIKLLLVSLLEPLGLLGKLVLLSLLVLLWLVAIDCLLLFACLLLLYSLTRLLAHWLVCVFACFGCLFAFHKEMQASSLLNDCIANEHHPESEPIFCIAFFVKCLCCWGCWCW